MIGAANIASRSGSKRLLLLSVLALSLALNLVALDWGLPAHRSTWSFDELPPSARGHTALERHGGRYPPLHYDLLRAVYAPIRSAAQGLPERQLDTRLYLAGRLLSVLMAVGTVALVYRLGLHLLGEAGAALLAAFITAVCVPLVRYAKTINLDVPYVFWFALSLLALVRVLERHRWRDYLLLAVAMAAAIGTKDQAAGLYLALPLLLVPSLHAHRRSSVGHHPIARTLFDPRLWVCLVLALVVFAWIHRLFSDPEQFRAHVEVLLGKGSADRADFEASAAGLENMSTAAIRHIAFALGAPLFVCALAGLFFAIRERRLHLLGLLLLVAVYYAAFMVPVRYIRLRFFLPFVVVLSLFAALALWRWLTWRRLSRPLRIAPVAALLLYAVARPVCLDAQMVLDSRYRVELWLAEHIGPDERWIAVGDNAQRHVRGGPLVAWKRLQSNGHHYLRRTQPEFVVVNLQEGVAARAEEVIDALTSGVWGYAEVLRYHAQPCCGLVDWSHVSTNLVTVNPPMAVFRRAPVIDPDAHLAGLLSELHSGEDPEAWARVAELIVGLSELEFRRALGKRTLAFGIHGHGWTRGTQPAAIVLENRSDAAERVRLTLRYSAPSGSPPQRVRILTPSEEHAVEIAAPGHSVVRLAPLAAGERRAVLVLAETAWRSGSDTRNLGVGLSVRYDKLERPGRAGVNPRRRESRRPRGTRSSDPDRSRPLSDTPPRSTP